MKKYVCNVYYTYCATVEVEADSPEEAADAAYEKAEVMPTDELEYVDHAETLVIPKLEDNTLDYENSVTY